MGLSSQVEINHKGSQIKYFSSDGFLPGTWNIFQSLSYREAVSHTPDPTPVSFLNNCVMSAYFSRALPGTCW